MKPPVHAPPSFKGKPRCTPLAPPVPMLDVKACRHGADCTYSPCILCSLCMAPAITSCQHPSATADLLVIARAAPECSPDAVCVGGGVRRCSALGLMTESPRLRWPIARVERDDPATTFHRRRPLRLASGYMRGLPWILGISRHPLHDSRRLITNCLRACCRPSAQLCGPFIVPLQRRLAGAGL